MKLKRAKHHKFKKAAASHERHLAEQRAKRIEYLKSIGKYKEPKPKDNLDPIHKFVLQSMLQTFTPDETMTEEDYIQEEDIFFGICDILSDQCNIELQRPPKLKINPEFEKKLIRAVEDAHAHIPKPPKKELVVADLKFVEREQDAYAGYTLEERKEKLIPPWVNVKDLKKEKQ